MKSLVVIRYLTINMFLAFLYLVFKKRTIESNLLHDSLNYRFLGIHIKELEF